MFNSFLLYIIVSPGSVRLSDPFQGREMWDPSAALTKRKEKEDDFNFNIRQKLSQYYYMTGLLLYFTIWCHSRRLSSRFMGITRSSRCIQHEHITYSSNNQHWYLIFIFILISIVSCTFALFLVVLLNKTSFLVVIVTFDHICCERMGNHLYSLGIVVMAHAFVLLFLL